MSSRRRFFRIRPLRERSGASSRAGAYAAAPRRQGASTGRAGQSGEAKQDLGAALRPARGARPVVPLGGPTPPGAEPVARWERAGLLGAGPLGVRVAAGGSEEADLGVGCMRAGKADGLVPDSWLAPARGRRCARAGRGATRR